MKSKLGWGSVHSLPSLWVKAHTDEAVSGEEIPLRNVSTERIRDSMASTLPSNAVEIRKVRANS